MRLRRLILLLLVAISASCASNVGEAPPQLVEAIWDLNQGPTAYAIEQARK